MRRGLRIALVMAVLCAVPFAAGRAAAVPFDGPTISAPGDITTAATDPCGSTYCASVSYSFNVSGGTPPYTLNCNLPSGGQFTVGSHTVTCSATDAHGNSTPPASFTVTVTGGGPPPTPPPPPPPLSISAPSDITAAATAACGSTYCATVSYSFSVSGGTPPYHLVCNLDSGGQFTVGSHTVSCIAQDSAGDSTPSASFTITVSAPAVGGGSPAPAPPPASLSISPPSDITAAATAACGSTYCANVSYSFSVSGGTPPYHLVCNLDSGGQFTVGSHTVSCLAQDSRGNSTPQASFTLTVTPPASGTGSSSGGTGGNGGGSSGASGGASSGGASSGGGSTSGGSTSGGSTSGGGTTGGGPPPSPTHVGITGPATVTVPHAKAFAHLTITSTEQEPDQVLCWYPTGATLETCAKGSGTWHVRVRAAAGKQVFVLETNGKVVAKKTVTIRIKA